MNNSTKNAENNKSVVSIFAEMTDERKPKGVRHQFQPLLVLLSLARVIHIGFNTPSACCRVVYLTKIIPITKFTGLQLNLNGDTVPR